MYKKIVDKYINDVQSGKVLSCKWVKLSIDRHLNDLKRDDIYFDEDAATRFLKFSALCKYTKGKLASKNLNIEFSPQQLYRYWCLFGWKNLDGTRRFRKVYFEVARKNGKSEEAAVVCAYMLLKDGEFGADVFTLATKIDQAKIVFLAAKEIIRKLANDYGSVKKLVTIGMNNVAVISTNSKLEPLSNQSDRQDGSNPHLGVIDEYHAHPNSSLLEVIQTGMGSRVQPMLFIITTAGFEKQFPCYGEERKVATEILQGIKTDDSLFSVIYTLDEGDDWRDENVWVKSNPNIGITPTWEYMRQQLTQALNQGVSKEVQFKTKNLNIWTDSSMAWINDENWMKCGGEIPDLTGRECYAGLDLASKIDMNALVLLFPPTDDDLKTHIIPFFWMPKSTIESKKEIANIPQWVRDGYVFENGIDVVDVRMIAKFISDIYQKYKVIGLGFDSWGSTAILHLLHDEGIDNVFELRQGYRTLSEPTKEVEALVLGGQLNHGGNPVLRWQMGNVELSIDPAENIKPDKSKSRQKIDGIAAMVNALAVCNALKLEVEPENIYQSRGIREI